MDILAPGCGRDAASSGRRAGGATRKHFSNILIRVVEFGGEHSRAQGFHVKMSEWLRV